MFGSNEMHLMIKSIFLFDIAKDILLYMINVQIKICHKITKKKWFLNVSKWPLLLKISFKIYKYYGLKIIKEQFLHNIFYPNSTNIWYVILNFQATIPF